MFKRIMIVLALISTTAAFAQEPAPAPQPEPKSDKVKLAAPCAKGDAWRVKTELLIDMDIVTADFRGNKLPTSTKLVQNEEFAVEVAEGDANGPAVLKAKCLASTVTKDLSQPVKTSIDGKTLTLRKTEKGLKVDAEGLDAKSRDLGFAENLDFFRQFLPPGGEASLKQQWKFKPAGVLDILSGGIKGDFKDEMVCTLTKVENNVAEITLAYEANGAHTPGASSKAKFDGLLLFDTATGRPVALKLAGKLSMTSEIVHKDEGSGRPSNVGTLTVDGKKLEISVEFAPAK